jgi:hypothetical protein
MEQMRQMGQHKKKGVPFFSFFKKSGLYICAIGQNFLIQLSKYYLTLFIIVDNRIITK